MATSSSPESYNVQELAVKSSQASSRAREKARSMKWDLNIMIFLVAIIITIIIMVSEGFEYYWTAPIAVLALFSAWLMGYRKERMLYDKFLEEELADIERELSKKKSSS